MAESIDWMNVRRAHSMKDIGAIGFIGDRAAITVSYFDDADWNEDGQINPAEQWGRRMPIVKSLFFKEGRAVTGVLMAAIQDPDILMRDLSLRDEAAKSFLDFATGLVFDGLYIVYFSRSVKAGVSAVAKSATNDVVKQYIIRKGMEKAVKRIYDAAVKSGTAFK